MIDDFIYDVAAMIRWHDWRDVTPVGHSFGGMVVIGFADRVWGHVG